MLHPTTKTNILLFLALSMFIVNLALTLKPSDLKAQRIVGSSTTSPKVLSAAIIDVTGQYANLSGGACYRFADNDGNGWTFLSVNKGVGTFSLTCN